MTIGETYNFEKVGPDGEDVVGTVTTAIVMEAEKAVMVGITTGDTSFLAKQPLSDQQLADYKAPDELVILDALPLNATSKVDKTALAAMEY